MVDECLREKVELVRDLSKVIVRGQRNVEEVEYELYEVHWTYEGIERTGYEEFLVVRYKGGAYSAIPSNGNSFYAYFNEIAKVLEHGNYDHERYESVKERAIKVEVE